MDERLLDALKAISPDVGYEDWYKIGIALKNEGFPFEVWDGWSSGGKDYHPGEMLAKWNSFESRADGVKGGTIVEIAKRFGYQPGIPDEPLDWDAEIQADGIGQKPTEKPWNGAEDFKRYLQLVYKPNEKVAYTVEAFQGDDGKWKPQGVGRCDRTAEELIAELEKYNGDVGAVIGDAKPEAGAWIRPNPVNGGIKDDNVTAFRHCLVESDVLSINDQIAKIKELQLPCTVIVHSGGKSIHAIVKIEAANSKEYKRRVDFLFGVLERNGMILDKANRNPSRLSRLPGVMRNGIPQKIIAENAGKKSWGDWESWMNACEADRDMPKAIDFATVCNDPTTRVMAPVLIDGLLRRGHKMMVTSDSKAGKSFLLSELALALATGSDWLGFRCEKARVLYINLEIDAPSFNERMYTICSRMGIDTPEHGTLDILNLRGYVKPLDQLKDILINRYGSETYDVVIFDPVYKIMQGDENSAKEMSEFVRFFDEIAVKMQASVIFCHHHSKSGGAQYDTANKASGSGVFARDPDCIVDLSKIDLALYDIPEENIEFNNATAWMVSATVREFASPKDFGLWFNYPLHIVDHNLDYLQKIDKKPQKPEKKSPEEMVASALQALISGGDIPTVKGVADYHNGEITQKAVKEVIGKYGGRYVKNGNDFEICGAEKVLEAMM